MPNNEITHVTLVLDRSGSMQSVRDDAIGGFNAFVQSQRKLPGRATLTLVQFDDRYEEVYRGKAMGEVPMLDDETFEPRGSTALYDALGRSLAETAEYVRGLPEHQRPGQVVVALLTDGQENASQEYTHERVRAVVKRAVARPGWKVLFLASELEVVRAAADMGVPREGTAVYDRSARGTVTVFGHISESVAESRLMPVEPTGGDDPNNKPN